MKEELSEEAIKKITMAGKISGEARDHGARLVEAGRRASEICEAVENYIIERGALPAFPCNISINEVAAHYTPGLFDDVTVPEGAVVKIDVGAHIDGYIGDTAVTVDLSGKYGKLLDASREALEAAMKVLRAGISLYDIGKVIQNKIRSKGFRVIKNLTGHTIGRYMIHAGISIPNYADRLGMVIKISPGTLLAIEPFATNGKGLVKEGSIVNIFAYTGRRPKGNLSDEEDKVINAIVENFRTLPFTPRWLRRLVNLSDEEIDSAIKGLVRKKLLHAYPILVEAGKGIVSQFEHTFLVLRDEVIVTTKLS